MIRQFIYGLFINVAVCDRDVTVERLYGLLRGLSREELAVVFDISMDSVNELIRSGQYYA